MSQQLSTREKPEASSAERVLVTLPKICVTSLLNTLRSVCCCWIYFSDLIECKKYKLPHQTLIIMGEFTFVTKYYMYLCALQMHKCCHGPISAYETIDMYTKNSTSLSRLYYVIPFSSVYFIQL